MTHKKYFQSSMTHKVTDYHYHRWKRNESIWLDNFGRNNHMHKQDFQDYRDSETNYNGLLFNSTYLPREIITHILSFVDSTTLVKCQLVCKSWKQIIWDDVWPLKVSTILGQSFPFTIDTPRTYYLICEKKPFHRNLIKNHSGAEGMKHWEILRSGGNGWAVETPPSGISSLPIGDSVLEGKEHCFVTSYRDCTKLQFVDLMEEGFSPDLMDNLQPPILVSEWYGCRSDCRAYYKCSIKLLGSSGEILQSFEFGKIMKGADQNQWFKVSHEFINYGPGVRKVVFQHMGQDRKFWAGHYGSKMAGACVFITPPKSKISKSLDMNSLSSSSSDSE